MDDVNELTHSLALRYMLNDLERRLSTRCTPYNYSLISSMSASRSAQLLEPDRSLWLVLDYGTVCHLIGLSLHATLSHFRRELKTFLFRQSYPSILF